VGAHPNLASVYTCERGASLVAGFSSASLLAATVCAVRGRPSRFSFSHFLGILTARPARSRGSSGSCRSSVRKRTVAAAGSRRGTDRPAPR
jgi:hypothetical protein